MSEKDSKKRPRAKQTYQHHKSAICISVYDPTGATIPPETRKLLEDSVWAVASEAKLLISIANE